ncbi:MAG: DUF1415 domain-containing protein [Halieaceae bacterium]
MTAVASVQHWLQGMVIGLDLCPFAGRVWRDNSIRFVDSTATSELALLEELKEELELLGNDPEIETTLLIHPNVLQDFMAFNDFLDSVDALMEAMKLTGHIQVASFHPQYRFAGESDDSASNYTNRSPYPILHLLREDSVAAAISAHPDAGQIPANNIAKLEALGLEKIRQILDRGAQEAKVPQSPSRSLSHSRNDDER